MIAQSDIWHMPLADKIALLEPLWTDLSSEPEQVKIPQWHKVILDERLQAPERGDVEIIDWEMAKEQIRNLIR